MLRWLLALLLIPFLDAVLLAIIVSQTPWFSWVAMVLLVVLTGLVGMLLVRAEGRRTIRKIQRSLERGEPPTNQLLDGALLIAAGAFLLTPGLVTDLIGFLLVLPPTRIPIRAGIKRFVVVPYVDKKTGGFASGTVWTFGFPDDVTRGSAESTDGGARRNASTYDLSEDDYTVESDDGEDSYRIEFGDDSSPRDEDDEPDEGHAR